MASLGPKMKVSTANCPSAEEQSKKLQEALSKGGPAALQSLAGQSAGRVLDRASDLGGAIIAAGMGLRMKGQPMSTLVGMLTQFTGKTIQDKTGLTGRYDFELTFDPEVLMRLVSQLGINIPAGALPPSTAPSLLTSLNEQLGLKLENEKAPGQVLVIDSAELPMPDWPKAEGQGGNPSVPFASLTPRRSSKTAHRPTTRAVRSGCSHARGVPSSMSLTAGRRRFCCGGRASRDLQRRGWSIRRRSCPRDQR